MAPDDRQPSPGMPRSRRIPGDIGWKPDPADPADADGAGVRAPGLALRVVSVIPFLVAGVTGVIALVGWVFLFIFGVGDQPTIWEWARGKPAGEVLAQTALVLLLGVASLAVTALAMWAALQASRRQAGPRFWTGAQFVFGVLALAMVLVDQRYPDVLADLGIGSAEWWLLFAVVGTGMTAAHLRMRRERAARKARAARGDDHARVEGHGAG